MGRITPRILLASASPRRQEILRSLGISFTLSAPDIDETWRYHESAEKAAIRLARSKAAAVSARSSEIVVGMDTIVAQGRLKLGKPVDAADARRMLEQLSGERHRVVTGVAIRFAGKEVSAAETTLVYFRKLRAEEIRWYIDTGEPFDKAGAYGIQGAGKLLIEKIEGCYFNVVGFPVNRFAACMQKLGFSIYDFMKGSI